MQDTDNGPIGDSASDDTQSRRNFLKLAGATIIANGMIRPSTANAVEDAATTTASTGAAVKRAPSVAPAGYNILFILTDQERYFNEWPFPVPGREELKRSGITFTNHQIASCVCSPSRSTIYTGQHIQHTGVFDNANLPWQPDLSTNIRTIGHMLTDAGYYTAYLGKWHLGGNMEKTESQYTAPVFDYNKTMKQYGFNDYFGVGDLIGYARGGYDYDGITTESAVSWMRSKGVELQRQKKPWFLAVNLVNPHDAMFVNTDPLGSNLQNTPKPFLVNRRPPNDGIYSANWGNVPLANSIRQPFDEKGRPPAHGTFIKAHGDIVGAFPFTDERIRVYQNYYFNCIRDCDEQVTRLLRTLDSLGLTENTIVVFTSDHGDHVGAHQMIGKGASTYRQQNHVPFIIRHPAYPGGTKCEALTSHVDIAPTLVGLTGLDPISVSRIAGSAVVGTNVVPLLTDAPTAKIDAIRETALFNYAMFVYYDSEWLHGELKALEDRGLSPDELHQKMRELTLDFQLRGAIRSVFDGCYRFSRYFSLLNFNQPATLEALFKNNDIELFDLQRDPDEMKNLALSPRQNGELLLAMNAKLNRAIEKEVGDDSIDWMPIRDGKVQFQFRKRT
ncbi:sulfatase-like hydrolase/transferase [Paraburkholderia sp. ZP32-5]|uniref:sulfatase-like hydrolase/transferase n=1 Tax=Paraburkholderia sp. ZP32-5 TaxID=2883245 RepID=UPI001F15D4B0|nr:sulfatase-like hydrolase/transferase [Paraburkholderia sp. ZP32-5]